MQRARVVALCGLPGSGKSTLARALQECLRWQRLDRDRLRGELFGGDGYSREEKLQLADAMRERLRTALLGGDSVILDGMTFSSQAEREMFSRLAESLDAHWQLVWIDCDPETAKARIHRDALHPAVDRTPALVDEVAARFAKPDGALRVDGALDVEAQVQMLLVMLARSAHGESRT